MSFKRKELNATGGEVTKRRRVENPIDRGGRRESKKKMQPSSISLETMNQIIQSINPNAIPLRTYPAISKPKSHTLYTPNKKLIRRVKAALISEKLHQKQLAEILNVR